ncbi:MFS transporter [Candidatus Bipolaricaulota bacterium]|nr:MFS transporter [Candidatus Bipolaricaulota bacterium]
MVRALRSWWHDIERWYVAVGLANLALGTSSVLIPLSVSKVFGHSVGSLGVLVSLVSLVGVLGSLVWGRVSDAAHRRKPFIMLGYAASGLCFLGVSLAQSFLQLMILNMLLNFFWVANASVTILIVVENSDEGSWERKISHLNQIGALGWVLGLAVGSLWMQWMPPVLGELTAIRVLFWAMGLIGLVASLLAVLMIPRTVPQFTQRKFRGILLAMGNFISERARFAPLHLYHRLHPKRVIAQLRRPEGFRPGTKLFFLSTLIAFVALGFFGIPLPLLLSQKFGLPSSSVFFFFLMQHAGIVLAYPFASRRIRKSGNRYVQMGSLWMRMLLFGGFAVYLAFFGEAPPLAVLIAAFIVYGITWPYFQLSGIALTSRLASEENRGLALGLYNAIAGTGWILAGLGSGLVAGRAGYPMTFAIAGGLLVLSLAILLFVPDPAAESTARQAERIPLRQVRLGTAIHGALRARVSHRSRQHPKRP